MVGGLQGRSPTLRMAMGMRYSSSAPSEHAAHFQTASTCHISERLGWHPSAWSAKNILLGLLSQRVIVSLNDFHKNPHGFLAARMWHPYAWSAKNILLGLLCQWVIVSLNDFHKHPHGFLIARIWHPQNPSTSSKVGKTPSCTVHHLKSWIWTTLFWSS